MRARRLVLLTGAAAGAAAAGKALLEQDPRRAPGGVNARVHAAYHPGHEDWRTSISSHDAFTHDSIDSLGYDWGRIADPRMAPVMPRKVYLPRTTEEIISVVREAKSLGERLHVRASGHSSNELVLTDGGSILLTRYMNKILAVDEEAMTATVQPGLPSAVVDDHLADLGYGLPVIGDHKDVTVGGFSSAGGIGPASFRYGMFVDNVVALEYVDWDGELHACTREQDAAGFHRVLGGLGRYGVLASVTTRIIKVDKYATIWKNHQTHYGDRERYIEDTLRHMLEPGEARMQRGIWIDLGRVAGQAIAYGQFSSYHATAQSILARLRNTLAYDLLHGIGFFAGHLPREPDRALKLLGTLGIVFNPRYASIKNVEFFADKILDSTVGDPTRMLIVLVPLDRYAELFRRIWTLLDGHRAKHGCFTIMSAYVKGIRSAYLAGGGENDRFCELNFTVGIDVDKLTDPVFEEILSAFDDICIELGAFRYMHTRTVQDPERLRLLDPNTFWSDPPSAVQHGAS